MSRCVAVQTLSGEWVLAVDPDNKGRGECWFDRVEPGAVPAPVPGFIQDIFPNYHGVAWYWHVFRIEKKTQKVGEIAERRLLRFGAIDYLGEVWVNGRYAGSYEGGETPFELDVSDAIDADGENLLAVRVLNPADTPIDGIALSEIPHANRTNSTRAGSSTNMGGITCPVELRTVPAAYVSDVLALPDMHTGEIAVSVTVQSSLSTATAACVSVSVAPAQTGEVIACGRQEVELPPGLSEHESTMCVSRPRAWQLDDPYLYRVTATLAVDSESAHESSVRVGFRELRVVDGYFHLNGRRIFLKSAHTCPGTRRDVLNAKAAGFNMIRFIAGVADPRQLELCDEVGLMVYEECRAGWQLADSPKMGERFDHSTSAMIRRDRNHACVAIWAC